MDELPELNAPIASTIGYYVIPAESVLSEPDGLIPPTLISSVHVEGAGVPDSDVGLSFDVASMQAYGNESDQSESGWRSQEGTFAPSDSFGFDAASDATETNSSARAESNSADLNHGGVPAGLQIGYAIA